MKTSNHRHSIVTADWALAGVRKSTFFTQRFWLVLAGIALAATSVSTACKRPQSRAGQPVAVDRVLIQFTRPANFKLLSRTSLTKTLTPSDQLPAAQSRGFWFELQSASGQVKYRRIIGNPVWPAGYTGPAPLERVFPLLIPSAARGDRLVLFSSPLTPEGQSQAARPIARFDLAEVPK
jgi:hypothetical protein